jgi:hypothetical protein
VTAVPVLQDEVNRKAFDTIAWLTLAVTQGNITPDQFSTGIDALFMATSGLVTDPDYIIMIGEAQGLIEKVRRDRARSGAADSVSRPSFGDW